MWARPPNKFGLVTCGFGFGLVGVYLGLGFVTARWLCPSRVCSMRPKAV